MSTVRRGDALGGQFISCGGVIASSHQPLDLPPPEDGGDGRSFSTISSRSSDCSMCFSLSLGQRLSLSERAALDRAVREAYIEVGITEDPDTHTKPPPTMTTVQSVLDAEADLESGRTTAASLAERLAVFTTGSLAGGLLGGQTNVSLDSRLVMLWSPGVARGPLVICDVSGCRIRGNSFDGGPDGSDCWWSTRPGCCCSIRRRSVPGERCASGAFVWVGLVFVTQDIKNVLSDARGSVVVDNLFTTLLLRQSSKGQQFGQQTHRLVADHFGLSSAEQRLLAEARPGEGLLLVGPWRCSTLQVIASPGEARVAMSAPRERQAPCRQGGRERWRRMTQASLPTRPLLDIQAVKRAYKPVEVVETAGVRLRRSGPNTLLGLCPFHQERELKLRLRPATALPLLGCGVHGDVVISCGCTSNLGRHRRRARG